MYIVRIGTDTERERERGSERERIGTCHVVIPSRIRVIHGESRRGD